MAAGHPGVFDDEDMIGDCVKVWVVVLRLVLPCR